MYWVVLLNAFLIIGCSQDRLKANEMGVARFFLAKVRNYLKNI